MRVLITAGPTREYIDSVRFISNASSGRMGRLLAEAAAEAEAKARAKLAAKGADYVVANSPRAIGAEASLACMLSGDGAPVPWARRDKGELAKEIIAVVTAR